MDARLDECSWLLPLSFLGWSLTCSSHLSCLPNAIIAADFFFFNVLSVWGYKEVHMLCVMNYGEAPGYGALRLGLYVPLITLVLQQYLHDSQKGFSSVTAQSARVKLQKLFLGRKQSINLSSPPLTGRLNVSYTLTVHLLVKTCVWPHSEETMNCVKSVSFWNWLATVCHSGGITLLHLSYLKHVYFMKH